jgi:hypothetical protein
MKNLARRFISLLQSSKSKNGSSVFSRHWILGLSLIAASLAWGCPKQDPLQAFNSPPPNDPGPAPVPEPVTALLFGTALLIGGAIVRRRRNGGHNSGQH